ncbi:MAG: hypothetical protein JRN21_02545 [Nitrososphaerota archaeon]|nr:hypothetical protein [Nitrososphaerota archaeon]
MSSFGPLTSKVVKSKAHYLRQDTPESKKLVASASPVTPFSFGYLPFRVKYQTAGHEESRYKGKPRDKTTGLCCMGRGTTTRPRGGSSLKTR